MTDLENNQSTNDMRINNSINERDALQNEDEDNQQTANPPPLIPIGMPLTKYKMVSNRHQHRFHDFVHSIFN